MARRQYPFHLIEPKWQQRWAAEQTFRAWNPGDAIPTKHPFGKRHGLAGQVATTDRLPPKCYILDMFPYPSGDGLHVGHPEGYTATDILSRYRRACGFNVLHPMGWDAFGLPAEQYAVKTGQHPRLTTERNIANFTRQIKALGFSYDWTREVATTDPGYFRWTQWIFLQIYHSWFNPETNRAEPISTLPIPADCDTEEKKRSYRDAHRLAFVAEAPVNWCPELGTVLANEEVMDGKSEVGGFPVIRKPMRQWMLRITAYAERLLADLETIEWSESLKEMQRNWIGRSEGAEVDFAIADVPLAVAYSERHIRVFTTRPDTLFGATYMVLAPEHPLISSLLELARKQPRINGRIRSARVEVLDPSGKSLGIMDLSEAIGFARQRGVDLIEVGVKQNVSICFAQDYGGFRDLRVRLNQQVGAIQKYRDLVAAKSDLERTELAKEKTGVWTGAYATNPVNGEKIPIWIADYVLASYGTGAIMAVPAHDERDWEFAKEFYLPIVEVVSKESVPPDVSGDWPAGSPSQRSVDLVSAGGRNLYAGGDVRPPEACYVGDGFGINSTSGALSLNGLPTAEAKEKIVAWLESKGLGTKTINYKLRDWLFSRQRYWGEPFPIVWKEDANGDLFHEALPESALPVLPPALDDYKPTADGQPPLARATDWVELPDGSVRETNTMPQWAGSCWYYLRYLDSANASSFVSTAAESYWMSPSSLSPLLSPVSPFLPSSGVDLYVGGTEHAVLHLLYARFWHKVLFDLGHVSTPEPFFKLVNQGLILGEDGQKMSKSRGNVVNPDDILNEYGADALRLFEMFMGPLSDVKPWNTQGVAGVYKFLGRVWRLFVDEAAETAFEQALVTAEVAAQPALLQSVPVGASLQESPATPAQLKALHACIKKVTEDLEGMRFNTAISAMMIFVNEAMTWGVKPVSVLRTFLQLLAPFAPHLAEELWEKLNVRSLPAESLSYVAWPAYDPSLLVEDTLEIPVQVNGKLRAVIQVPAAAANAELESAALAAEKIQPFLAGKTVKKIIVVPRKLVNVIAA